MLLLLRLFEDELAHKLAEQLAHGVHALLACCHVIDGVAHGEEDRLHSSSVRTVVHLDIALAYVADSDDSRGGLQLLQGFLEAVESADLCEDKVMGLGELVCFCEGCEEGGGIPIDVLVCHFVCRLMSSTSFALASSSVSARHVSIESTASSLVMSPPVSVRICAFMAVRSTSPMGGA